MALGSFAQTTPDPVRPAPHQPIAQFAPSFEFQTIAPCHYFELASHRILNRNDRSRLKYEGRKHGTELVHGDRVVAVRQHIATPIANTYDEHLDLKVGRGFPLTKHIEYPLLRFLVFDGGALRTLIPRNHVFHVCFPCFL
jgi:hypothetical protein